MKYDPKVTKASEIAKAITDLGFPTTVINDQDSRETDIELLVNMKRDELKNMGDSTRILIFQLDF